MEAPSGPVGCLNCPASTVEPQPSTLDYQQAAFTFYLAETPAIRRLCHRIVQGVFSGPRARNQQRFDDAMSEALRAIPMAMATFDASAGATLRTHVFVSIRWYVWKLFSRVRRVEWLTQSLREFQIVAENSDDDTGTGYQEELFRELLSNDGFMVEDRAQAELSARDEVYSLIDAIPNEYAVLLQLRYIQGMTLEAIGQKLGLSKGRCHEYVEAAMLAVRKLAAKRDWNDSPMYAHARNQGTD